MTDRIQLPEQMQRHPWGKVPAITFPDGFTLYESRAISKYLARKYNFPLLPSDSDVEAAAQFDEAQSVQTHYFAEPAARFTFEKFAKKFLGLPADEVAAENALKQVDAFFDVAERLLQKREYMAGGEFTLVDIDYIPVIQRLIAAGHGNVIFGREAVAAWWNRCISRPAIRDMLAADKAAAEAAGR